MVARRLHHGRVWWRRAAGVLILAVCAGTAGVHAQDRDEAAAAEPRAASAAVSGTYDDGFLLTPATDRFSVKLNGFVQARFTAVTPESGDRHDTFDLALGRVAVSGSAFGPQVSYLFQVETTTFGNSNGVSLLDGWVQYTASPRFMVRAGRILLPYSRQFYTHPGMLLFADLSATDYAFNLPRSVGVHVGGKARRVSYDLAVANSVRALDASGQQNRGEALALVGRVEVDLLRSYGYLESAPAGDAAPQLSVGAAAAYNPVASSSVVQHARAGDDTTGVTLDAGWRWQRLSAQGAFHLRRTQPQADALPTRDDRGGYVQAGLFVVPQTWELAGRVSTVRIGEEATDLAGDDVLEYSGGVNR